MTDCPRLLVMGRLRADGRRLDRQKGRRTLR